jgi:hypothetical protein
MENFTRKNSEFWLKFTMELTQEINEKGLLLDYIEKISVSKKKEGGHSNAQSYVDYLISDVLPKCETLLRYGFVLEDSVKEREHGDFYLLYKEKGYKVKVRCNGKLGMSKKLGQPNLCSLERTIDYLDTENLPYLIFKLRKVKDKFEFNVFDLFNYVDIVSYNDGPGQLMMSESKFYKKKEFKYLKTFDAIVYLSNMNELAYNNLIISRDIRYNKMQNIKKKYERNEI